MVEVNVMNRPYKAGKYGVTSKIAFITVKWNSSISCERIKSVKITGLWKVVSENKGEIINEVYEMKKVKSNSIRLKNRPLGLMPEISTNVKVTGETDAIVVKGVAPGENIKVYTSKGAKVKSVLANKDVVNIKLPKNQIYIVKAGEASYKVAL